MFDGREQARVYGKMEDHALQHLTALGVRERLIADLQRDNVPPGRISVLLLKTPRGDEEKHLQRMGLRRLSGDVVLSSL